jgi:two-component system sensor histidine kinase ChiS
MTIFVADIRSFTPLSESMTPQEIFNFLNAYLGRVSPIIREHNGFIDKYIGDEVLAIFPESPEDAVQAAIAIREEIIHHNKRLDEEGYPALEIGIGIQTGNVMLGTIGEDTRRDGTVISDVVNLASRIEGLNKLYGAGIIISEQSLFSLDRPAAYQFRFLDRVQVKGKSDPVSVFEIFDGDPAELVALKLRTRTDFEKGLLHYHSEEFAEAQTFFKAVLEQNSDDKAASLYLKRATDFLTYGVPTDWGGIEALTEK